MKGNSEEHPDAYLIFRIFVDSITDTKPVKQKKPTSKKQSSKNQEESKSEQSKNQSEEAATQCMTSPELKNECTSPD